MCVCGVVAVGFAEDWPTYRHDNARSGVTAESLKPPLSRSWVFLPRHAPQPAWGDPDPLPSAQNIVEGRRVHFDDVLHVVAAGGAAYFGSSANGKVYSLDAATGKVRWAAFTGGPVRLAPTVWKDKVYVGSDDGFAYCLRASDGEVVWKLRAGPTDEKLLGHGRMISMWPLRSSVVVDGGIAYFGAGIFPAEGVYLYAARPEDGTLIWRNDTIDSTTPDSFFSPQGYLLASRDRLFAPMGRVSPVPIARKSGRVLGNPPRLWPIGGTYALLVGDNIVTGTNQLYGYSQRSGAGFAWFAGRQLVVTKGAAYLATEREMVALDRSQYPKASLRRRRAHTKWFHGPRWQVPGAKSKERMLKAAVDRGRKAMKELDRQIAELAKKGKRQMASSPLSRGSGTASGKGWRPTSARTQPHNGNCPRSWRNRNRFSTSATKPTPTWRQASSGALGWNPCMR